MEAILGLLLAIDWMTIGVLSLIVTLASLIANLFEFRSRFPNVLLTVFFFALFYIAWFYFLKAMVLANVAAG